MDLINFIIGLTLMNAMPHFIVAVFDKRMLSAFGTSSAANLAYAILNFATAIGLFVYERGIAGFATHGVFSGALAVLLAYFLTGRFWYRRYNAAAG